MREAPQMLLLFLGECHWAIIVVSRQCQAFKKQCSLALGTRQRRVRQACAEERRLALARGIQAGADSADRAPVAAGIRCVDLGAAPGGWSQYAARIVGGSGTHRGDRYPGDGSHTRRRLRCRGLREEAVLDQVLQCVGATRSTCFVRYGPQHGRHRRG